jgi:quinol-cytochrome oxidoreductase complex cytochrome b subunit
LIPARIFFLEGEFVGLVAFGVAAAVWIAVPFIDRKAGFGRLTRFFTGLGIFALGYIVMMSALAFK